MKDFLNVVKLVVFDLQSTLFFLAIGMRRHATLEREALLPATGR